MRKTQACLALLIAVVGAVELTDENWEKETSGKVIFVKFYTSDCNHCKSLKPKWDQLSEHWTSAGKFPDETMIVEVNCDQGSKTRQICGKHTQEGFPTIKWGRPDDLDDFSGDRYFEIMKDFVDTNLKPLCSPSNEAACDEEQLALLARIRALSLEELKDKIRRNEEKVKAAEKVYKDRIDVMKEKFNRRAPSMSEGELRAFQSDLQFEASNHRRKKEKEVSAIKQSGLRLAKAVLEVREAEERKKDEF